MKIKLEDNTFLEVGEDDFIDSWVSICFISDFLEIQDQYVSRFFNEKFKEEYPYLGGSVRFKGDLDDYHFLEFHKEDVPKIIKELKIFYNK